MGAKWGFCRGVHPPGTNATFVWRGDFCIFRIDLRVFETAYDFALISKALRLSLTRRVFLLSSPLVAVYVKF